MELTESTNGSPPVLLRRTLVGLGFKRLAR
jgi:hypothetical protein